MRAAVLLLVAACAGPSLPAGSATLTPARPRVHVEDLVCAPEHALDVTWEIAWLRDGRPYEGAVDGTLPGDTVPVDALTPGSTWTCLATPVDGAGGRGPTVSVAATVSVPSVLLVVVDDVGYGDLGTYGGPTATPSLDALAARGVRFDAAYAAAPVCSPSRAGLLTGRHPSRFGFEFNLGEPALVESEGRGLPYGELTLGELARDAGLATGFVGKWHLGLLGPHWPYAAGFDDHFGFLSGQRWHMRPGQPGAVDHWPEGEAEPPVWPHGHWSEALVHNGTYVAPDPGAHLTDVFADAAAAWIEEHGDGPSLLVLSFLAAHEPVQALADHLAAIPDPPEDEAVHAYRAMIAALDAGLGRVLAALDASGRADDTLVIVVSDNGCPALFGLCDNGGLSGGKVQLTEGGLRVPMIAAWPDRLPAGVDEARPVSLLDVLPTVAAAVGATLPADLVLDGVDLRPFLQPGVDADPHPVLAWRLGFASAVRAGAWKLTRVNGRSWLHDVVSDPGELHDLASEEPARLAELSTLLEARALDWTLPAWSPQTAQVTYHGESVTVGY